MHPHQASAFGNATGISQPKKMNISSSTTNPSNNNNSIPRIKSSNTTTTQACAACKYQRRKCEPNCILSPYFPHNRQSQFLNAHKLFGVSNITKIIRNLSPADKDQAMKTIIFQSDVRANDPVGGCYRIIRELQFMIEFYQAQLDLVLNQLSICRAQQAAVQQAQEVVQTSKDHHQREDHDGEQQQSFLPFMADQAGGSDPSSDVINADTLGSYCPSSLQYRYHPQKQQQLPEQQLHLHLGGNTDHRDEEDNYIVVHGNNGYGDLQDNVNVWVQQADDQQQQARMVNYCLNNNEDEDQNISKESNFDHNKDLSDDMKCYKRFAKLTFDVENHHHIEDESSHEEAILNEGKTLCRLESGPTQDHQGDETEESADDWFALTTCKRRKTV